MGTRSRAAAAAAAAAGQVMKSGPGNQTYLGYADYVEALALLAGVKYENLGTPIQAPPRPPARALRRRAAPSHFPQPHRLAGSPRAACPPPSPPPRSSPLASISRRVLSSDRRYRCLHACARLSPALTPASPRPSPPLLHPDASLPRPGSSSRAWSTSASPSTPRGPPTAAQARAARRRLRPRPKRRRGRRRSRRWRWASLGPTPPPPP